MPILPWDWAQWGSPDLGSALLFLVRGDGMAGTDGFRMAIDPAGRPGLDDMLEEGIQAWGW